MKGRVVVLDQVGDRLAAALMVDGRLEELAIDPPEDAAPPVETIFRATVDRLMGGQGGAIVRLPDQATGFLRGIKGLELGQSVIVQVTGLAEDGKAVPVSLRVLFKSRYAIVTPQAGGLNIARSIRDEAERDRLQGLAHEAMMEAPDDLGLILRSACEGVEEDAILDDIAQMRDLAQSVMADVKGPPEMLVAGADAHHIAWRDWSLPDPDEVVTEAGAFAHLGVPEAVDDLMTPRVDLGGGAWAMIETTSALVAVDVNTGGDGSFAAGLKANLALARDLSRQLRLRGLAGQIVLDPAPMPKKDRRVFEEALKKAFRNDPVDMVLAGWTPLGHFELQRKRDRFPLRVVWPR